MDKLTWKKVATREFSFLFTDYVLSSYPLMEKLVGTTLHYNIAHGEKNLVAIYRVADDVERSYALIKNMAVSNPERFTENINNYNARARDVRRLISQIAQTKEKEKLKQLLLDFDKAFLELMCYNLFFVYVGYAAHTSEIRAMVEKHSADIERIRMDTIFTEVDKKLPELFGTFNARLGTSCTWMNRHEIIDYLNGIEFDSGRVEARKKYYLIVMRDGDIREYYDVERVLREELSHLSIDFNQKEIRGTTAHSGLVRGPARVVFSTDDYKNVKEGDIVVTAMTRPEVVPFLHKAKGIVTNDGGALCHASIVARELGVPCVVGTVHATDIIKDGELIEVDATKGVVRRLP